VRPRGEPDRRQAFFLREATRPGEINVASQPQSILPPSTYPNTHLRRSRHLQVKYTRKYLLFEEG